MRNIVRAGVTEKVAMTLRATTMTVFDRYDIVSEAESGEVVGKVARG